MEQDNPRNRRTSSRKEFRTDCSLEIVGPTEYMGLGLLQGRTVNLTEHGLMVMIPGLRQAIADAWLTAVEQDKVVIVQAILRDYPLLPPLKGQIVWVNWREEAELGPTCYLGLLFHILEDSVIGALQEMLKGLETHDD